MAELNMTTPDVVFDVDTDNFETRVLQASQQHPVMVDFWAPWCGPCQSLGPMLEKLAREYGGAFTLAKVNTDDQQMIAAQFGIRSLPTVVLLYQGQILDHFVGAQSEGEVRALLERHIGPAGPPAEEPDPAAAAEARAALPAEAQVEQLQAQLAASPEQTELQAELVGALLRAGRADEAHALFEQLPAEARDSDAGKAAAAWLAFADAVSDAPPLEQLLQQVEADPAALQARYQLGARHLLAGDNDAALTQFLEIMKRDRGFEDDLGRRSLVAAFSTIADTALVGRYRSRMTSLLF